MTFVTFQKFFTRCLADTAGDLAMWRLEGSLASANLATAAKRRGLTGAFDSMMIISDQANENLQLQSLYTTSLRN